MKNTITILSFALVLLFISCGEKKETATSETEVSDGFIHITKEQFTKSGMVLGNATKKPFPVTIQTNGVIDVPPENRAVVSATMGGYIKNTPLLIGDVVKKGQVLVTIENPEFVTLQQNYMEVKQQLTYLQSEYDRQKTLKAENITSQKSFLKAESEYKTAQARYTGLKKQLQMLHISSSQVEQGNITSTASVLAPISGSITKMNVTKGTYVSPATPILEIIDNDHIHIELSVFEKDIMKIKKGQEIQFKIPEASEETYKAEVHLVGTSIDENRTIKLHGHLHDEEQHNFLTGMFVNAEVIIENTTAMALPDEAIVEQEGKFYVLKAKEQTGDSYSFESVEIQPGKTANGFTALSNNTTISATDNFVTKGAYDVLGE